MEYYKPLPLLPPPQPPSPAQSPTTKPPHTQCDDDSSIPRPLLGLPSHPASHSFTSPSARRKLAFTWLFLLGEPNAIVKLVNQVTSTDPPVQQYNSTLCRGLSSRLSFPTSCLLPSLSPSSFKSLTIESTFFLPLWPQTLLHLAQIALLTRSSGISPILRPLAPGNLPHSGRHTPMHAFDPVLLSLPSNPATQAPRSHSLQHCNHSPSRPFPMARLITNCPGSSPPGFVHFLGMLSSLLGMLAISGLSPIPTTARHGVLALAQLIARLAGWY